MGVGFASAVVAGPGGAGAVGAAVIVDERPGDSEVFRYDLELGGHEVTKKHPQMVLLSRRLSRNIGSNI